MWQKLLGFTFFIMFSGCGIISPQDLGMKKDSTEEASNPPPEMIEVSIGVKSGIRARTNLMDSFNLVSATALNVSVKDCASGYETLNVSGAATTLSIPLYKYDRTCNSYLNSFGYNGKTYVPSAGVALKSYATHEGDSLLYKNNADATDLLMVRVHTTLPAQLTAAGVEALFVFQEILKGADHSIANYSFSESLTIEGIQAPNLIIDNVELTEIKVDGSPVYKVTFTCAAGALGGGAPDWTCASASGDLQKIVNMKVKIIDDPLNAGALSYTEAETAMGALPAPVSVLNADKSAASKFTVDNANLTPPGKLYEHKNMLLVVSYTDPSVPSKGTSYKFYNLDIGDPL